MIFLESQFLTSLFLFQGPSIVDNPNCPEQALSMVELVRLPPQTEENIYCPGPFQVKTLVNLFLHIAVERLKFEEDGLYSHNF